jgi:hypothetical protein
MFLRHHLEAAAVDIKKSSEKAKDVIEANLRMESRLFELKIVIQKLKARIFALPLSTSEPQFKDSIEERFDRLDQRIRNVDMAIALEYKRLQSMQDMVSPFLFNGKGLKTRCDKDSSFISKSTLGRALETPERMLRF